MKRIIALLMTLSIVMGMVACGESEPPKSKYLGTWNAASLEAEGVSFTVDELKALGEDEIADFTFVIKEGGKAYVYVDGDSDLIDWEETEDGIKIGEAECVLPEVFRVGSGARKPLPKRGKPTTISNSEETLCIGGGIVCI